MSVWNTTVPTSSYTPCPAGNQLARITALVDLGHHLEEKTDDDGVKYEADTRKLCIVLEAAKRDEKGKPFTIGLYVTFSLGKRATLFTILKSIYGRELLPGEDPGLATLPGTVVLMNVSHKQSQKKNTIAKVENLGPVPDGMPIPNNWEYEPFLWSVSEDGVKGGKPCPANEWLPMVWCADQMRTLADAASLSCESRGVTPVTRPPSKTTTAAAANTFHAPTHAQSVGAATATATVVTYPPEVETLRVRYGLDEKYTPEDLEAKQDDIPPRHFAALREFAEEIPF